MKNYMKNKFFYTFHQNWDRLKQKIFCVSLVSFLVIMPIFGISTQNNGQFFFNNDRVDLGVPSAASSSDYIIQDLNDTWGGPSFEEGFGIATDSVGNIYITGQTESYGAGISDAFILKYNSSGTRLWNITWGEPNNDGGRGIAIDAGGNIYITGYTTNNAFILKFDSSGTLLWNTTWGGPSFEVGFGIAIDSGGYIYITGYTTSYGAGISDTFIVKYNSSGTQLWNTTWGGLLVDIGSGIAIGSSGNIYITGYTDSSGAGNRDAFIVKYDSSGTLLWNTTWGGPNNDGGKGIVIDSGGNIYITGFTNGNEVGNVYALIVKFDSSGTPLWNTTWGGLYGDEGDGIAIDSGGNIYITGNTYSYGAGIADAFIVKYDSSGTQLWNTTWGSPYLDYGYGIAIDSHENIYITGLTCINDPGSTDAFIVKYIQNSEFSIPGYSLVGLLGTLISTAALILTIKKNRYFKIGQ